MKGVIQSALVLRNSEIKPSKPGDYLYPSAFIMILHFAQFQNLEIHLSGHQNHKFFLLVVFSSSPKISEKMLEKFIFG